MHHEHPQGCRIYGLRPEIRRSREFSLDCRATLTLIDAWQLWRDGLERGRDSS